MFDNFTQDLAFADGDAPPVHIIDEWLALVDTHLIKQQNGPLGVHCVAGLGRFLFLTQSTSTRRNGVGRARNGASRQRDFHP